VQVVVVSEGPGRAWLERARAARGLSNLTLLDYQPYQELPQVLASGDILGAVLNRGAGTFAVPSKVLSYLCAARPLLLAVPGQNLAARTVRAAEAGLVVEPDDAAALVGACRRLVDNPQLRVTLGRNGRHHAEQHFDIRKIAERFERVLDKDLSPRLRVESAAVKTA
jgi:glycosyltransferase involved in cell wall biosynthesis